MLACTPFTVVSYFLMWYVPPFVSGRVAWYLAFYCLFQALTVVSRLQIMMFSAVTCLFSVYVNAFTFSTLGFANSLPARQFAWLPISGGGNTENLIVHTGSCLASTTQ